MAKPKVATVWLEACAGCHMSFLDMDERLIDLFSKVEITSSPITDIKEIPEVTVGVIEGGLGNEEELHIAKNLREKCALLIAWGDCAVFGGINCMRNFMKAEDVIREAYTDTVTTVNPSGVLPHGEVPALLPQAIPVDRAVKVDVYVPGCPPDADTIAYVFNEILEGRTPKVPSEMLRYD
ncbi:MAG: NADP oxidoreductase [Synergistaceae bacterium]|jgi:NAD-reducing hydrogenase small subunit|nr:NADP oxidoreductase [Synergistaceae bacterium]